MYKIHSINQISSLFHLFYMCVCGRYDGIGLFLWKIEFLIVRICVHTAYQSFIYIRVISILIFVQGTNGHPSLYSGLLVLLGLIVFVSVEKIFSGLGQQDVDIRTDKDNKPKNTNNNTKDVYIPQEKNGFTKNGIKPVNKNATSNNKKKHVSLDNLPG